MFGEGVLGGRLLLLNLYLSPAPPNLDLNPDQPVHTLIDITSLWIRNVVRQDAVVAPHLCLAVVVVPRLPLVAFDVGVVAVVDHTTIAPMVRPLATHLIEHRNSNRSLLWLLQG